MNDFPAGEDHAEVELLHDDESMPVTIVQLAIYRLGLPAAYDGSLNGAQFESVGLPIMGGCERCHASIAAYNAHPSLTGFLQCSDCIADLGYATVEEANRALFPAEYVWLGREAALLVQAAPALRDACVMSYAAHASLVSGARARGTEHEAAIGAAEVLRIALAKAGLDTFGARWPQCSVCRRRHGTEVTHECE